MSISMSFQTSTKTEKTLLGTFNVYIDENDNFIVEYTGKYDACFTRYLIKRIYFECDSTINETYLDSMFQFVPVLPDTVKPKIKTTRI